MYLQNYPGLINTRISFHKKLVLNVLKHIMCGWAGGVGWDRAGHADRHADFAPQALGTLARRSYHT